MTSQPALSQADAASSLLSLSLAAATATPVPLQGQPQSTPLGSGLGVAQGPQLSTSLGTGTRHHRRLASTGKTKRRLSDARDAANRPSPALLQSAATSLASLSLSSSPPPSNPAQISSSFTATSNALNGAPGSNVALSVSAPLSDGSNFVGSATDGPKVSESTPIPITGKGGKKRGVDHKCESCSKIYRHPSCLIKHRWEHTPHWREASKFVLSKHQQVQLLEAAAILSHLSPSATSLPEDRSLWPSFLSGGSLPKADNINPTNIDGAVSSSVPASGNFQRSTSSGPRLHDYSIPASSAASGGITQLRPGLVGVSTASEADLTASKPVPVPHAYNTSSASFRRYRSGSTADSWSSQFESGNTPSSFIGSAPFNTSSETTGGRSFVSASSHSRSRSGSASGFGSRSRSDDESLVDVDIDVEPDADLDGDGYAPTSKYAGRYGGYVGRRGVHVPVWKKEEDEMSIGFSVREEDEQDEMTMGAPLKQPEWDGMEMEMEMD